MDQQYTIRSSYGKAKSMPNVGKFRLDLLRLLRSSDSLQAITFCHLCLNFSESDKLLSRSVYNKVTDLTGLMLSANSLPIHSLEVYCQFVSCKKWTNFYQSFESLPLNIAKTVNCAHAQCHGANAQSTVDLV